MVGDEEVNASFDGFRRDGRHRVYCEENPADHLAGLTADQPYGVPLGREGRRIQLIEDGDHVAQRGRSGWRLRSVASGHAGKCAASAAYAASQSRSSPRRADSSTSPTTQSRATNRVVRSSVDRRVSHTPIAGPGRPKAPATTNSSGGSNRVTCPSSTPQPSA